MKSSGVTGTTGSDIPGAWDRGVEKLGLMALHRLDPERAHGLSILPCAAGWRPCPGWSPPTGCAPPSRG